VSLNKEHLNRWIDDLRTTKAVQGRGALHSLADHRESFCCLGRLCQVASESGLALDVAVIEDEDIVSYDKATGTIPKSVAAWLGNTKDALVLAGQCIAWNDTHQLTFSEIADKLESKFELDRQETP
jgi:hypothetical protein